MFDKKIVPIVDSAYGVYIPQLFAEKANDLEFNLPEDTRSILLEGPDHPEYWEAWDEVLNMEWKTGRDIYSLHHDMDLYMVCKKQWKYDNKN